MKRMKVPLHVFHANNKEIPMIGTRVMKESQLNRENAPEIIMKRNSITHYWAGEPTAPTQRGKEAWDKLFKKQVSSQSRFRLG